MAVHSIRQTATGNPPLADIVQHGDMMIGPDLAKRILSDCFYHAQEGRMKSAKVSILRHVVRLRRGRWLPGSQITFCRINGGRLILVNGYHRLNAVVEFGDDASFNVQIIETKSGEEVDSIYSLFDRAKDARIRSREQGANALHFADRLGVSKTLAKTIGAAVLLIQNDYRPVKNSDREKMVEFDGIEDQLDLAMTWKREAREMDEILNPARGILKRKLMVGPVLAIALTTLRHQPQRAPAFWLNVARNDGLRKNTPEHTLVDWLLTYRMEANSTDGFVAVSLAWNAFYYNKPIGTLRVGAAKGLRIAGTPVKSEG